MKRTLVVSYSRTGVTRRIAREIAGAFDCEIEEIQERRASPAVWGFLRSAFQALFNRPAAIKPLKNNPALFDLVVIGTPIWLGKMASPVRTYVVEHQADIKAMAFFCTNGRGRWENALRDMRALTGRWPVATVAFSGNEITEGGYKDKLHKYLYRLSDHTAPRLKAIA